MRRAQVQFDLRAALPAAWKLQWERAVKMGADHDRCSHVTASDLEAQLRTFAQEQADGKPWGSAGAAWGKPFSSVRIRTAHRARLLDVCRDWLLGEVSGGRLASHNFGRGHISGMRFRPVGVALTVAEKQTMHRHEHPTPYAERAVHAGAYPLCTYKPGSYRSHRRGRVRGTDKAGEVTCPACKNLLAAGDLNNAERAELAKLEKAIAAWRAPNDNRGYKAARAKLDEQRRRRTQLAKQQNAARWQREEPQRLKRGY